MQVKRSLMKLFKYFYEILWYSVESEIKTRVNSLLVHNLLIGYLVHF
jgi:hypothetical protein